MLLTQFAVAATVVLMVTIVPREALPHPPSGIAEVKLVTQPEAPRAGEHTVLTFTLADDSGEPLESLITHHDRKLHVVIVSEDMQVLGHIHPYDFGEGIEGGEAAVSFTFPRPGQYLIAADYMTAEGAHAEHFTVEVAGAGAAAAGERSAAAPPSQAVVMLEDEDRYTESVLLDGSDKADGYAVSLRRPDRIEAGEPVTITYRFSRDGAPLTDLRPYLDAPLHLAVVRDGFSQFLHEHGTLPGEAHAGHDEDSDRHVHGSHEHAHASDDHAHHGYEGLATFGPEVAASFTFPDPGQYYLFSQAAHGDRLLISRMPVEVH